MLLVIQSKQEMHIREDQLKGLCAVFRVSAKKERKMRLVEQFFIDRSPSLAGASSEAVFALGTMQRDMLLGILERDRQR